MGDHFSLLEKKCVKGRILHFYIYNWHAPNETFTKESNLKQNQ